MLKPNLEIWPSTYFRSWRCVWLKIDKRMATQRERGNLQLWERPEKMIWDSAKIVPIASCTNRKMQNTARIKKTVEVFYTVTQWNTQDNEHLNNIETNYDYQTNLYTCCHQLKKPFRKKIQVYTGPRYSRWTHIKDFPWTIIFPQDFWQGRNRRINAHPIDRPQRDFLSLWNSYLQAEEGLYCLRADPQISIRHLAVLRHQAFSQSATWQPLLDLYQAEPSTWSPVK